MVGLARVGVSTMEASLSGLPWPPPPHRVQPGSFLTLHYRLAGPGGDIINTFRDKPATLTLGTGELSPAVEQRLIGLEEGAHATLRAARRRGLRRAQPGDGAVGGAQAARRDGRPGRAIRRRATWCSSPRPTAWASYAGAVQQVGKDGDGDGKADAVLFDFNHPLAGQPVTFEVQVIGVL